MTKNQDSKNFLIQFYQNRLTANLNSKYYEFKY